jgi:hypothetical protein
MKRPQSVYTNRPAHDSTTRSRQYRCRYGGQQPGNIMEKPSSDEAVPKATAAGGLAVGTGLIGSGAAVPAATTRPIKRVEKQGTGPSIPAVNEPRTDMPEHKGSTLSEHRTGPAGSHPLGTARSRCSYHRTRSRVDSRWRLDRPSFVRAMEVLVPRATRVELSGRKATAPPWLAQHRSNGRHHRESNNRRRRRGRHPTG